MIPLNPPCEGGGRYMRSLYVSMQGCYVGLSQELLVVKQGQVVLQEVQLPLLEQVLIFGKSQVTTQAIRECLRRDIPIAYLSRMGFCYGRVMAIGRGYRQLVRYQQNLSLMDRLLMARQMVRAKILNGRTLLMRQGRKGVDGLDVVVQSLDYLADRALLVADVESLLGVEGSAAAAYFGAFSLCLTDSDFVFGGRVKRPPSNPVNALLSFGYMVLWNHLLSLVELQGLDPYFAFLHQDSERHPALASDAIEEFRTPIVDSLVLYLINNGMMSAVGDFEFRDGGCFLNESGRRKFLKAFLGRMEERVKNELGEDVPRWDLLMEQVRKIKRYVYDPSGGYKPYLIR
jgi:CRISPR-associated protein Cas1